MNFIVTSLLQIIDNPHASTVDQQIATFIIKNHMQIKDLSITELSQQIGVSISQMSRFVKSIGLSSYSDFKELLIYHGHISRHTCVQKGNIGSDEYFQKVHEEMHYFFKQFHLSDMKQLVHNLHNYSKVALFGILNSGNIAKELQYNLISRQKICYCYESLNDQLDFIKKANSDTLIVIFSMSGGYVLDNSYVRHYGVLQVLKNSCAKIYVITQNKEVKELSYIDNAILIPCLHRMYNLSLQWFIDLLVIEYDRLLFP